MKWRKLAALCLSLSMMVTMLTACGGGSTGGTTESFDEQVNDLLTDRGYNNTDVVQSVSLDNAVKDCADSGYDKDTIRQEMMEKFDWYSGDPETGIIGGFVYTIPEENLMAGEFNLDDSVNIDEEKEAELLAKFAPIDSVAKVAAFQIAAVYEIAEQQKVTILESNASWAKAETEEGEPYWIIVVQFEVKQ